ncbi:MAG: 50S ribosomal protein L30e [Candidatus Micrarchaeota archaeon]
MELDKSIRLALDSGKVVLGANKAIKSALNADGVKLVVIAANCREQERADLEQYCKLSKVPVLEFKGTSMELGVVCGKPFPVSALSVFDEGDSELLQAVR